MAKNKVTKKYKEQLLPILKDMWYTMQGIEFNDWRLLAEMMGVEYEPRFEKAIHELYDDNKIDIYPRQLMIRIDYIPF